MSYCPTQHAILLSLGIEQLPGLHHPSHVESHEEEHDEETFTHSLPIREAPVPGKRCPDCLSRGQVIWVLPGKKCQKCGKEVN